jgi:hypothetical protein
LRLIASSRKPSVWVLSTHGQRKPNTFTIIAKF